MLKIKTIALCLATALFALSSLASNAGIISGEIVKWHTVTIDFAGPAHDEMDSGPNPFLDYRLQVTFSSPTGSTYSIPGFFDGDGAGGGAGSVWRVRFSPDEEGTWTYTASFRSGTDVAVSLDPSAGAPVSFHGDTGTFDVQGTNPSAPGFLGKGRLESVGDYYFKFRDAGYWIKGGMDSPENFLGYDGFDNTPYARLAFNNHTQDWNAGDPDWDSANTSTESNDGYGIIGALNYLASQKLNSIYFMPMNIGADGKDTWPYASTSIDRNGSSSNDNLHFDISKLTQWEETFDHAQRLGIFLHFVLSDREDTNKNELDNATLGVERKLFYRELIARFGHHNALQWNISEEYNLDLPLDPAVIKEFAQYINDVDDYDHPVTVHNSGSTYVQALTPFVGDSRFTVFSVQTWQSPEGISNAIEYFRDATASAGQIVPTAVDESIGIDQMSASEYRKRAPWDALMSGGGHELFVRYQDSSLDDYRQFEDRYRDFWYARKFIQENLPFWEMTTADDLVTGENPIYGGAEVFVKQGEIYAVYLPATDQVANLFLGTVQGDLRVRWYSPRTGEFVGTPVTMEASSNLSLGPPPEVAGVEVGEDWAVLVEVVGQSGGGSGVFRQSTAGLGLVSMESESYTNTVFQNGKDWVVVVPGGQSGAAAMEAAPNTGTLVNNGYETDSPRLDFDVEFAETGTHYVWIRALGDSDGASVNDSVHVGLDGMGLSTSDRMTNFNSTWSWSSTTMDSGSRSRLEITEPGVHTVNVWMREDGLIVDKVVLTTDPTFDPVAAYGSEGPPESAQGLATLLEPVISPESGTYFGSVDVSISAEPGSSIYYTLDGTDPTTSSTLYTGAFTLNFEATVKSLAVQDGWNDSPVASASYVFDTNLLAPTISPAGGAYLNSVSVTMAPGSSGAEVRYTLDGSTPTSSSILYTGLIALTADTTVRAITALAGFTDSPVVSESYTITSSTGGGSGVFRQSTAGLGLVSMESESYTTTVSQNGKDWVVVVPGGQSGAAAMEAAPNTGTLVNNGYETDSPRLDFDVEFAETGTHYVWIRALGDSDGASVNDSVHVGLDGMGLSTSDRMTNFNSTWSWSSTTLDSGSRSRLEITEPGVHTVNVWMREDGLIVDKVVLTTDPTFDPVAAYGSEGPPESAQGLATLLEPVISPESGTYFGSVDVSISAEPGSSIYYTLDGTDPTTSSTLYTGAFTLNFEATVKSLAVQDGWNDSPVASASYVFDTNLLAPTISPAGGAYLNSVSVTMAPGSSGAEVRYTLDGSTPTSSSILYTGLIALTADTTVRAITALAGFTDSPVVSESYTITSSTGGGSGVFRQSTAGLGLVSMESESYTTTVSQNGKDWVVVVPGGQSGAAAMEAAPNTGTLVNNGYETDSPRLDFDVEFAETGTHYVWIRALGDSDGASVNDSVHVGLDGMGLSTSDRMTNFNSTWSWSSTTLDSGSRSRLEITEPGVHTVNVWMREDGLIVDKVVLTTDPTFDPVAAYGSEGPPESAQGLATLLEPVISPESGTYFGSVDVSISAEPGSSIYYTLDGTDPTTSSTLYTGAFTLNFEATVKSLAVQDGWNDSPVASASYVFDTNLLAPTISPAGGAYLNSVSVTMAPGSSGAEVRYTLDGSTPTSSSILYTGLIALTADTTVRAITALAGFTDSPVVSESYTITSSTGGGSGVFRQSTAGLGLVSMESESYTTTVSQNGKDWVVVVPGGQSGAAAMEAAPNTGTLVNNGYETDSPRLDFDVEFAETGTHYVWIRALGDSDGASVNDSVHVGLDGMGLSTSDRMTNFNSTWSWSSTTMDSGSRSRLEITEPGVHTVNVWMREDGLIVDKVVLTTDPTFDPVAAYGSEGPPESEVGSPSTPTAPEISPNGGTFSTELSVSLTGGSGGGVFYTLDGTDPDQTSIPYNGPFIVSTTTTLKAITYNSSGLESSDISEAAFTQTACQNTRVMPLGDSITLGRDASSEPPSGYRTSYRRNLYISLVEASHNVDFVGGLDDGELAVPAFDSDHEGHGGWRDDQVARDIFDWLSINPADVVLLHIGTNGLESSVEDVDILLDEIDRYSTDVHVVVAKIINRQNYSSLTTTFNTNLENLVTNRISAGDKLSLVDMENALLYPDDLADALHPNANGFEKMADVWFNDLSTLLPACAQ